MPDLYKNNNGYGLRNWETPRLDALEELLVAQQRVNMMVVAALDDLRSRLPATSS